MKFCCLTYIFICQQSEIRTVRNKYITSEYPELIFLVLMERKTRMLTNDSHTWHDINYSLPIIYFSISFSVVLYLDCYVLHSFCILFPCIFLFHITLQSFSGLTKCFVYYCKVLFPRPRGFWVGSGWIVHAVLALNGARAMARRNRPMNLLVLMASSSAIVFIFI
jgi:hypothetical protein